MSRASYVRIIDRNEQIEQSVAASGPLRVDGCLRGEVWARGDVLITDRGEVNGAIIADNVAVLGSVRGDIYCSGEVEIAPGGHVEGAIVARRLAIQGGGVLLGTRIDIGVGPASESIPVAFSVTELERWVQDVVRPARACLAWDSPEAFHFLFDELDFYGSHESLLSSCERLLDRLATFMVRAAENPRRCASALELLASRGITDVAVRRVRNLVEVARTPSAPDESFECPATVPSEQVAADLEDVEPCEPSHVRSLHDEGSDGLPEADDDLREACG